jgi:hypothetical protein
VKQQDFDGSAIALASVKPGWENLAAVYNQQIALLQQVFDLGKLGMHQLSVASFNVQQAGLAALVSGKLSDQFLGQGIVIGFQSKQIVVHDFTLYGTCQALSKTATKLPMVILLSKRTGIL